MATATAVARYLQQQPLWGDTQLQKLVYYSQAWALAWTGRPLFDDEIQAWQYGPVTPAVWRLTRDGDLELARRDLTADERAIVDAVYAHYGHLGGIALGEKTHGEAPWRDAWRQGKNTVIAAAAMRRTYAEQALEEPGKAPTAPILTSEPVPADVRAAVDRQRRRWRPLLDRLADQ